MPPRLGSVKDQRGAVLYGSHILIRTNYLNGTRHSPTSVIKTNQINCRTWLTMS